MQKYSQSQVSGESWIRSPQVTIYNNYNENPTIFFDEEKIVVLNDGEFISSRILSKLGKQFKSSNANTSFELISPETEEYTGKFATFNDLHVLVHSIYFYLAKERDKGPQPYPSWSWSEETNSWISPIPKPEDGQDYYWDESLQTWEIQNISKPPYPISG